MDWEKELSDILEQEISLLNRIFDEARSKTNALKTADIDTLDNIVNREQPLALQLGAVEQKRLRLLEKDGLSGKTLSALCGLAGGDRREQLQSQLRTMTRLTGELKRVNDLNAELTHMRLEFYQFLAGPGKAVYENDGRVKADTSGSMMIDKKA